MSKKAVSPSSIDGIKRLANQVKGTQGLKHADALDAASRAGGFQNYAHARRQLESGTAPARGAPLGNSVIFSNPSTGWGNQYGKSWGGRRSGQPSPPSPPGAPAGGIPHSDGSRFSDGAGYSQPVDDGLTPEQRVERRLSELEGALNELKKHRSMLNRNGPPEWLEIDPLANGDIADVTNAITDVRSEIANVLPDRGRLEAIGRRATNLSFKIEIGLREVAGFVGEKAVTGPVYVAVLSAFADRLYALGDTLQQAALHLP